MILNADNIVLIVTVGTAIRDFRFAYPGESGQRNTLRGPGYFGIDLGLGKTWKIAESQQR